MCLWATLYLEAWKRTEKFTASKWGMVDFEQEQMSRPEFEALAYERESAVTGEKGACARLFSIHKHEYNTFTYLPSWCTRASRYPL